MDIKVVVFLDLILMYCTCRLKAGTYAGLRTVSDVADDGFPQILGSSLNDHSTCVCILLSENDLGSEHAALNAVYHGVCMCTYACIDIIVLFFL